MEKAPQRVITPHELRATLDAAETPEAVRDALIEYISVTSGAFGNGVFTGCQVLEDYWARQRVG